MNHADFLPVIDLLKNVGKQIVEWRSDPSLRELYSVADFKTRADQKAHALISEGLKGLYPDIAILSEESLVHPKSRPSKYWLIDPIDGTASWYNGFDGFVTQAAYIESSVPLYGIVHAPILKTTWTALKGSGAYKNGALLSGLNFSDRLVMVDNTPEPHGICKAFASHFEITDYIESGSLGLKSVFVADGTADLFVKDVVVRDWDIAPAFVIINEVGGYLSLADGLNFNFEGEYEKESGIIVARDKVIMNKSLRFFKEIN